MRRGQVRARRLKRKPPLAVRVERNREVRARRSKARALIPLSPKGKKPSQAYQRAIRAKMLALKAEKERKEYAEQRASTAGERRREAELNKRYEQASKGVGPDDRQDLSRKQELETAQRERMWSVEERRLSALPDYTFAETLAEHKEAFTGSELGREITRAYNDYNISRRLSPSSKSKLMRLLKESFILRR